MTDDAANSQPTRYPLSAMMADSGLAVHWQVARAAAGAAAAGGLALWLLVPDWRPAAAFGGAGLWSTAFLGSFLFVAMGLGPVPADKQFSEEAAAFRRKARRKVALLAVAAKIILFLVGGLAAVAVAGSIYSARGAAQSAGLAAGSEAGLVAAIVLPGVAGIHVLPAVAWLYWMARRFALTGLNPRRAAASAAGSTGSEAAK